MIRIKDITSNLKNLVGFRQSLNPTNYISDTLTKSDSGLYFQDCHPLLTLENIIATMPDNYGITYAAWSSSTTYATGNIVTYNNKQWKALKASTNQTPAANSTYWSEYNRINDYLTELIERAISKMVLRFIETKQLENENRDILYRQPLFDGAGNIRNTLQNKQNLVGFEIVPIRSMGVTLKLEQVGMQFYGGSGSALNEIYLPIFHSSREEAITTLSLSYTKTNASFQWFDVKDEDGNDVYLTTLAANNGSNGSYYIVYSQDDIETLDMEAVNVSKDWSREPCGTCNIGSLELWRELQKYVQISPFKVAKPTTWSSQNPKMFDITQMIYTNTQNWGLNFIISIGCDLSDFIIRNKGIFASVLQKQLTYDVLRLLALNPNVRVNRQQSNVAQMNILYELDGNTAGTQKSGLGYELQKSYKALNLNTDGLDRICLSCNNKGVRYRSV